MKASYSSSGVEYFTAGISTLSGFFYRSFLPDLSSNCLTNQLMSENQLKTHTTVIGFERKKEK